MRIDRHTTTAIAVTAWALLALTGCSGSSSAPGTTAPVSSAAAAAATTAAAADSVDATAFCALVEQQRAELTGSTLSTLLGKGTPAEWKAYLARTKTDNQALVDAAPAEIRSAVEAVRAATDAVDTVMSQAGYVPTKVGAAKLIATFRDPARVAAGKRLAAYVTTTCHLDLTSPA